MVITTNGDQATRRPHTICPICGRRFATHRFGLRGGQGWAHSTARTWVPNSCPLTHIVYLLPFWSLQSVSVCPPSRPTNNAQEARVQLRRATMTQKCLSRTAFEPTISGVIIQCPAAKPHEKNQSINQNP